MIYLVYFLTIAIPVSLAALDFYCYLLAKHPERSRHWWSYWPGSGFIALKKYGKGESLY